MIEEIVPMSPTGHLLHEATIQRLGDRADLSNTRNKYREAAKMKTKKQVPNERIREHFRRRTKENGGKQSTRYRVQNNGYKGAQGT